MLYYLCILQISQAAAYAAVNISKGFKQLPKQRRLSQHKIDYVKRQIILCRNIIFRNNKAHRLLLAAAILDRELYIVELCISQLQV